MTKPVSRKDAVAAHVATARHAIDQANVVRLADAQDARKLLDDTAGVAFIEKLRQHVEASTDVQSRRDPDAEGQEGSAVALDRVLRAWDLAVAAVPQRIAALTPPAEAEVGGGGEPKA